MDDMILTFRRSEGLVVATARNSSIWCTGSGPNEERALEGLERSINSQIGTVFNVDVDRTGHSVRLSRRP